MQLISRKQTRHIPECSLQDLGESKINSQAESPSAESSFRSAVGFFGNCISEKLPEIIINTLVSGAQNPVFSSSLKFRGRFAHLKASAEVPHCFLSFETCGVSDSVSQNGTS